MYNNNALSGDFIPVIKTSTKAVGLLDKKYNVFYPNNGTGTFKTGQLKTKLSSSTIVNTTTNHTVIANWIKN